MYWSLVLVVNVVGGCLAGGSEKGVWSVSDAVRVGVGVVSEWLRGSWGGMVGGRWRMEEVMLRGVGKEKEGMRKGEKVDGRESETMGMMMKVFGVESRRVQELALEGFISLVHLMCRVLIPGGETDRKDRRYFSVFRYILSQPQVADLMAEMQEPRLMEEVMEVSEEKLREFAGGNVECIRVLLCKTTPFVRGMQKSLRFFMQRENVSVGGEECPEDEGRGAWEEADLEDRMYFFVPSLKEVLEYGDRCDELFPNCDY